MKISTLWLCVCVSRSHGSSTPSVYGSRAESARNMEFVHVLAKDVATMFQLPALSVFNVFSIDLLYLFHHVLPFFFLVVSEAPWHNNPRDIVNIVGSGAFAALC